MPGKDVTWSSLISTKIKKKRGKKKNKKVGREGSKTHSAFPNYSQKKNVWQHISRESNLYSDSSIAVDTMM